MPYRKKTLRQMPEDTRKTAKAIDEAITALKRARKQIEKLSSYEWQVKTIRKMAGIKPPPTAQEDKPLFEDKP